MSYTRIPQQEFSATAFKRQSQIHVSFCDKNRQRGNCKSVTGPPHNSVVIPLKTVVPQSTAHPHFIHLTVRTGYLTVLVYVGGILSSVEESRVIILISANCLRLGWLIIGKVQSYLLAKIPESCFNYVASRLILYLAPPEHCNHPSVRHARLIHICQAPTFRTRN